MGSHINKDGEFQSDKYPTCPAGQVPLSVKDPMAQDLLWLYSVRRQAVDLDFSIDLQAALIAKNYSTTPQDAFGSVREARMSAEEMRVLRLSLRKALVDLEAAYANLTAAQEAGSRAVRALQHLRGSVRHLVDGASPVTMFDSLALKRAVEVSQRLERGEDIEAKT